MGGLNQVQNPGSLNNSGEQKPNGNTNIVANDALLDALEDLFETSGGGNLIVEKGEIEGMITPPNESVTVTESLGDLVQYTSTHLFYLKDKTLCVYSLEGESSMLVGMYPLDGYITEIVLKRVHIFQHLLDLVRVVIFKTFNEVHRRLLCKHSTLHIIIKIDFIALCHDRTSFLSSKY